MAGEVDSTLLEHNTKNETASFWKLNDLEGLTADAAGYVYAITSHSRDSDGDEKKSRDKLLRFRIAANSVVEPQVCNELKSALVSAHPELAAAASQRTATLYKLDLGGNGLRGMAYIAALSGYLIITGPVDRTPMQYQLWFWNGQRNAAARRVRVRGIKDFERAEGVCATLLNGQQKIMIVSDDGNRKENRYGQFVLLDTDALKPE